MLEFYHVHEKLFCMCNFRECTLSLKEKNCPSKLTKEKWQFGLDSDLEETKEGTNKRAGNRHQSKKPEIKDGLHTKSVIS